jgi:hypothetical protein
LTGKSKIKDKRKKTKVSHKDPLLGGAGVGYFKIKDILLRQGCGGQRKIKVKD